MDLFVSNDPPEICHHIPILDPEKLLVILLDRIPLFLNGTAKKLVHGTGIAKIFRRPVPPSAPKRRPQPGVLSQLPGQLRKNCQVVHLHHRNVLQTLRYFRPPALGAMTI